MYGTHRLLDPAKFILTAHDANIWGGTSLKTVPSSKTLRENSSKLLTFLDFKDIPKPPTQAVVCKILKDLQLPCKYLNILFKDSRVSYLYYFFLL